MPRLKKATKPKKAIATPAKKSTQNKTIKNVSITEMPQRKRAHSGQSSGVAGKMLAVSEGRRRSVDMNTSVRNVNIKSRQSTKWQLPVPSTVNFTLDLVDSAIENILGTIRPEVYEEVQATLNQVRSRLKVSLTRMKVPRTKIKNYHSIQDMVATVDAGIAKNTKKAEKIDEELYRIEMLAENLSDEKDKLESELSQSETESLDQLAETSESTQSREALLSSLKAVISSMCGANT